MIRTKFLIALFTISGLVLSATPALAAPPSNDTIAGATVIASLPFSDTVDTTEATTDADEVAAGQPCRDFGAPAIEKPVWYKFTAVANVTLLVDTTASSYTNGIAAYNGAPSAATFVNCAPGRLTPQWRPARPPTSWCSAIRLALPAGRCVSRCRKRHRRLR